MPRKLASLVLVVGILSETVSLASEPITFDHYLNYLIRSGEGASFDAYISRVMSSLRKVDINRDGRISPHEVRTTREFAEIRVKQGRVQKLLPFDLDLDGRVTAQELDPTTSLNARAAGNTELDRTSAMDADRDGTITFAEAAEYEDPRINNGPTTDAVLDVDVLNAQEAAIKSLRTTAIQKFDALDIDENLQLDRDEVGGLVDPVRETRALQAKAASKYHDLRGCSFPAPPAGAHVRAVTIYDGQSISSVTVDGPDQVTSSSTIAIEEGDGPLYVVVSSFDRMVWKFEGATHRVARVVAGGGPTGIAGIDADKVTFVPGCMAYKSGQDPEAVKRLQAALESEFGAAVASVGAVVQYDLGRLILPSGKVERATATAPPPGLDRRVYQSSLRFNKGGLAQFRPEDVVSRRKAETYDVLPQHLGLAQLVHEGSLEVVDPDSLRTFAVVRPIKRFPAGLGGALSVEFRLGDGVPMPAGHPGHSCVRNAKGFGTGPTCKDQ